MRIRERDGNFYLVRAAYCKNAGRGTETGLGSIPVWASPADIDRWLKPRAGVTLSAAERTQLEQFLNATNPPEDPIEMAAAWLEKTEVAVSGLPLRERQAKIRRVRPVWERLSKLAGTKQK